MRLEFVDYIKNEFRNGTAVTKLIAFNLAFYVVIVLTMFLDWAFHGGQLVGWQNAVVDKLAISSFWQNILWHIWSPITSIFLHQGFGHILFNMFALLMFGNIIGDLIGDRRVVPIYLLGGLVGNLFFFFSANLISGGTEHLALGASGAIMALAGASVAIAPDYKIQLLLFGRVPLKYVVLFMVLADLLGVAGNINTGGHFAHLGGLVFGWLFVQKLHNGSDLSDKVNDLIERVWGWFRPNRPTPTTFQKSVRQPVFEVKKGGRNPQRETRLTRQEALDAILDKIRLQGMASLTKEEKIFLDSHKDVQ
jgi:membrane associated rhomboid family serine protease